MVKYQININELNSVIPLLHAGDKVMLSGTVYTARDAAHKKITSLMDDGISLPFELKGSVIYYAGPTPTRDNGQIGSFGPTTSSRMDSFAPHFLDNGMLAMIGKGNMSQNVKDALKRNSAVYFCAGGGLGALISKSIVSSEEIAFSELGCESVKRLEVKNMPLITAIDSYGRSVFDRNGDML